MNRIIIADICSANNKGKSSGHYFSVAQNYIEMFGEDFNIYVAGGPVYKQDFYNTHMELPYDHIVGESSFIEKWHELINCWHLFRHTKGDIIIFQSVSLITTYIAILLFYYGGNKLFFIQYYSESINSKLKKSLWTLIQKRVNGIICSSDRVGKSFGIPYQVVTDYVYTKKETMQALSYRDREYDLCLVGGIFRDKGQVEALRAFRGKGLKVLIAGKANEEGLEQEIAQIIKEDSNIEAHIGYVSYDDYYRYIRQSKYCVLNYSGTYNDRSSGVVLDIIFNNTPVLGHKCGALQLIADNELGYIYDSLDKIDFNTLFSPDKYDIYCKNISNYLSKQKEYIIELKTFLKI